MVTNQTWWDKPSLFDDRLVQISFLEGVWRWSRPDWRFFASLLATSIEQGLLFDSTAVSKFLKVELLYICRFLSMEFAFDILWWLTKPSLLCFAKRFKVPEAWMAFPCTKWFNSSRMPFGSLSMWMAEVDHGRPASQHRSKAWAAGEAKRHSGHCLIWITLISQWPQDKWWNHFSLVKYRSAPWISWPRNQVTRLDCVHQALQLWIGSVGWNAC